MATGKIVGIKNRFNSPVNLATYTATKYTFPSDGYLSVRAISSTASKAIARLFDVESDSQYVQIGGWSNSAYPSWCCFVRKGMRCQVITLEGGGDIYFYPLAQSLSQAEKGVATGSIKKTNSYTTGTHSIWKYRKYDDGTFHLWYENAVNLETGTAFAGGFFHKSGSPLISTLPPWVAAVTSMAGVVNGSALAIYCGRDADLYTYWWNSLAVSVTNLPVRLDVYGTW